MKISVITITLNAERYIFETLHSVASQTYSDIEHIVFDGGSSDKTLEIARKFDCEVIEGKDEGISDAMNQAALYAKGDFLLFLHADDRLVHSKVIERVVYTLKLHPQIRWLYGRAEVIDENSLVKKETPFFPQAAKKLSKYNTITHPSTLIAKELFFNAGGYSKNFRLAMDYDLWFRLKRITPPFPYSGLIGSFREHDNSLSTSSPAKVADEAYQVRNQYLTNFLQKYRSYRTWKRRSRLINSIKL